MVFAASCTPLAAPATPGLVMVCATYTMRLPEAAPGPLTGPFHAEWVVSACRTATLALARTEGQPGFSGPAEDGPVPLDAPRSPPTRTVAATASTAALPRTVLRIECTGRFLVEGAARG